MDKININEINFEKLRKFPKYKQGSMSTMYTDGKMCIKRFNRNAKFEKCTAYLLEDRFSYLEEKRIKELVLPKTLLMSKGKVVGYEMELLKGYKTINEEFSAQLID